MAANILYDNNNHLVLTFSDLVTGDGIQSNQLVIINHERSAIFDPGGDLTYMPLTMALSRYVKVKDLDYIIATHQDPDIIASLDKWLLYNSTAKIVISRLWERFIPHLVPAYMKDKEEGRIVSIPDQGGDFYIGEAKIKAIPAHFLHSVGNLHFYDCTSKILFSGDVGASVSDDEIVPVTDFEAHLPTMRGFHRRYMVSNKMCRLWVNMIRKLDVEMIVPQHGRPFQGKEMIYKFLNWFENLECGIDLLNESNYKLP